MSTRALQGRVTFPNLGVGLGYRPQLHRDVIKSVGRIDFLEVVSDNFFRNETALHALRSLYTCVPHSLSLSVGSKTDPAYLERVRRIVAIADPPWFSDHLAFTRAGGIEIGHLAPVAHTEESLRVVVENVKRVQAAIDRPFVLENVTMPFYWPDSTMEEHVFLAEVVKRTGCYLLLDLENVRVNLANHARGGRDLIDRLPLERVAQVHIAGGAHADGVEHDTHSAPVSEETWSLLEYLVDVCPPPAVLLERDGAFPPFPELLAELDRARSILGRAG